MKDNLAVQISLVDPHRNTAEPNRLRFASPRNFKMAHCFTQSLQEAWALISLLCNPLQKLLLNHRSRSVIPRLFL